MSSVDNVNYSGNSEQAMYDAYVNQLSGGNTAVYQSNYKPTTYEHSEELKNLIPDLEYEDIDRSKCKDDPEYYAKMSLIACLKDLKRILLDPSISDDQSWMIYNTLVTYVEYKGESCRNDSKPDNKYNGLDDILKFLKNGNGINGDFRGDDMIDSKAYRELVTDVQRSLKKIKEETMLQVPDKKQKLAEAYFTGNSEALDYWSDKEED